MASRRSAARHRATHVADTLAAFGGIALTAASGITHARLEFADEPDGVRLRHAARRQASLDAAHRRRTGLAAAGRHPVRGQQFVGEALLSNRAAPDPGLGVQPLGDLLAFNARLGAADVGHGGVERLRPIRDIAEVQAISDGGWWVTLA